MREVLWGADGRLRSGWRILLFAALFLALSGIGGMAVIGVGLEGTSAVMAYQGATLAAAVLAGMLLLARADGRRPGALGFPLAASAPREALVGLALGAGILAAAVGALALTGMLGFTADEGTTASWALAMAGGLAYFAIPAAAEEALFRGYAFQALVEGIGPVAATVALSAVFAAAHANNPNVGAVALVNIFLAGVLLSVVYLRTRSLWAATGVHLGWNWAMATGFDLPVSGLEIVDTPLYDVVERGPDLVTGGAFGPEGGLVASGAFVLGMGLVLRLRTMRAAPETRRYAPLVDARLGDWGAAPAGGAAAQTQGGSGR